MLAHRQDNFKRMLKELYIGMVGRENPPGVFQVRSVFTVLHCFFIWAFSLPIAMLLKLTGEVSLLPLLTEQSPTRENLADVAW